MHLDLYNDTFDLFCNNIAQENAEILDVACGPGNITQYLLKKRPDFKILGIDLSTNMINLARLNNSTAEFLLMDCRKIGLLDKKFDGIMCGFCLPYLSKTAAVKLINDAAQLLNPNGVFYLSTMEENEDKKSGLKTSSTGDQLRPPYPEAKRRLSEEAILRLRLAIDDRGRVVAVDPVGRADPAFLAAARSHLLRHWRYRPASEGGRAVAAGVTVTLSFRLSDED